MINTQANNELQIAVGTVWRRFLSFLFFFGTLVLGKLTKYWKFNNKYDQNILQGNSFSGGPV